MYESH